MGKGENAAYSSVSVCVWAQAHTPELSRCGGAEGWVPQAPTLLTTILKAFVLPIEHIRFSFVYTIHNIFASMRILPC